MKNVRKQLKDLTIRDNFLFAAVMMQEDNCKRFLEMLLGIEIDRIEMQVAVEHLGKRIRYYHSQMDMDLLVSGHDYEELPRTYVIFICDFDPFGLGRYCYTFRSQCLEEPRAELGDGAQSIVLSTRGRHGEEISPQLEVFLSFIRNDDGQPPREETQDPFVRHLQESVRRIKDSREMKQRYVSMLDVYKWERKQVALETRRGDVLELLEELGSVPDSVRERIHAESNTELLKRMHKAAAKAQSIEAFEKCLLIWSRYLTVSTINSNSC